MNSNINLITDYKDHVQKEIDALFTICKWQQLLIRQLLSFVDPEELLADEEIGTISPATRREALQEWLNNFTAEEHRIINQFCRSMEAK